MISHRLLVAGAVIAAVVTAACTDTTDPQQLAPEGLSLASAARSGALHVEKECSEYTGHAGDFCTITSSSLQQIEEGSRVIYVSDAVGTLLDTDVVLDLPGPGNNHAWGHCTVDLVTFDGRVPSSREGPGSSPSFMPVSRSRPLEAQTSPGTGRTASARAIEQEGHRSGAESGRAPDGPCIRHAGRPAG